MKNKYSLIFFAVILVLSLPTFWRMLPSGLFSMQDFPYFRLIEYSKCFSSLIFPCRWASDAGLGYGEPVFNFYSHVPFFLGSLLIVLGISAVTSLKILFSLSFVVSAVAMFYLSKQVWKSNWAALVSSVLYLYAPYRAVDVWVRGALPESFAFIFLPLILLFFEKFLINKEKKYLGLFSLFSCLLVLTHNLSVVLFSILVLSWILMRLYQKGEWKLSLHIIFAGIVAVLLSSFYLLPSIFENKFVNLESTTQGYFNFRAHFVTLKQLFLSRYWGYGGSTWGADDGLNLSVGIAQWITAFLSFFTAGISLIKKKRSSGSESYAILLVVVGMFYLFLTHNKSTFLWEYFSDIVKYIQFPWRFLGVSVFCFSLASGYLINAFKSKSVLLGTLLILIVIALNISYFKEDIWNSVSDHEMQFGETWIEQTRASISDYWPKFGEIPRQYSHDLADANNIRTVVITNNYAKFVVFSDIDKKVEFPISYFPGWTGEPGPNGLLQVEVKKGTEEVEVRFENTQIRAIGNIISVISFIFFLIYFYVIS